MAKKGRGSKAGKMIEGNIIADGKITGAYATNPITQAEKKQRDTNVPLPDEFDVIAAKKRVDENHK